MSILRLLADQMTVPEGQGERSPPYRMFIRDLVLLCRIGVYAHEKLRPQRVRINVSMRVEAEAAPRNDDIANVLSYDEVLGGIKRLAAGEHINLVETLAEAIADLCLAHRRVIGHDSENDICEFRDAGGGRSCFAAQLSRKVAGLGVIRIVNGYDCFLLISQPPGHVGPHPSDSHEADPRSRLAHHA